MSIHSRYSLVPAALLLMLCSLSTHALQDGLQQRMSSADFKAAGLDTLSAQQLAHLDEWLRTHPRTDAAPANTSAGAGTGVSAGTPGTTPRLAAEKEDRSKVRAHIVGRFDGWRGDSQFTLDNGQVWRQVGSNAPSCASVDNPAVTVKPSVFSNWLMHVDGCAGQAHVRRVQ